MTFIADIGATLKLTPFDNPQVLLDEQSDFFADLTPFHFRVEDHLNDGQLFYGLFGPVIAGPELYQGLICNIFVRVDETDWRIETESQVGFLVGSSKAKRDHRYDLRFPDGTIVKGYPKIARFGGVEVVDPAVIETN